MADHVFRHPIAVALVWTSVALGAPPGVEAQGAPVATAVVQSSATETELSDLKALIAAERQRIDDLKAEIDQRDDTLGRLSARLDALGPGARVAAAKAVTPPVPAPASPPPRFDFYADTLVRLATLHQGYEDCVGCPDRTVGRLRLRFGAEGRLAPGVRAVLGLSAGELNDPNSVYQTLGGNFGRKITTWDRGYIAFRPTRAPGMELTAGKFPYTWLRSSMTFDVDFYPEGLSERFSGNLAHAGVLKNVSLQGMQLVVNEQANGPDTSIVGGQATAGLHLGERVSTRVVFTGLDLKHAEYVLRTQLDGSNVGVRNTNIIIGEGAQAIYASGFRYANLIVENAIRTPWESLPVTATVEYQRNLLAVSGRDAGTSLRLDVGRQQKPGDWGFGWHLFRVEQEAIASALGESDWRAPSNVLQQRMAVTRTVQDHVQLLFTWYRGRTLDRTVVGAALVPRLPLGRVEPWANRMYFDLLYRF